MYCKSNVQLRIVVSFVRFKFPKLTEVILRNNISGIVFFFVNIHCKKFIKELLKLPEKVAPTLLVHQLNNVLKAVRLKCM